MRIPLTFLAVPPLLLMYPVAYVLGMYRLFAAVHASAPALLTAAGLVNPTGAPPLATKLPIEFAEDAVALPGHEYAVISHDPSRNVYNPFTAEGNASAAAGGELVLLSLKDGAHAPLALDNWPAGREFHPLGLSVAANDSALLAVANLATPPGVDILRLHPGEGRAEWVRTLSYPSLSTPNSVVLLSERQALVTNSFRYAPRDSKALNTAETLLALPLGRVLLLTAGDAGTTAVPVSEGLALANGLALSDDGTVLVAAASTGQEVQIYDVAPTSPLHAKGVRYRETVPAGFVVDNLRFVSRDGGNYTFLAAGHPSAFAYLATARAKGEGKLSGSTVVKFTVEGGRARDTSEQARAEVNRLFTGRDKRFQLVFEDSGALLGTSSTALPLGRGPDAEMLVCGLFDRGVLWAKGVDLSPVQA